MLGVNFHDDLNVEALPLILAQKPDISFRFLSTLLKYTLYNGVHYLNYETLQGKLNFLQQCSELK